MAETPEKLWADHTVDRPGASACSCGAGLPAGLAAHVATLLVVDEPAARKALLAAHNNIEVSAGMCGGCDTCGSDAAIAVCAVCGEGYSPCPTYFEVVRNHAVQPDAPPAPSTIEGPQ